MEMIKIENLNKKYGEKIVYDNFNVNFEKGKITVVLGESGSGKTTLLKILASLTDFEGKVTGVPSSISMVFQNNRLAPNLTIEQNLKLVCPEIDVKKILNEVGLDGYEKAYPKSLSAGMARRVAVQRALAYPSDLLLMDEPLINLDLSLKYSLMNLIKKKQSERPITMVLVTHDIKEAVYTADRIVVLKNGRIIYDNSDITEKVEKELFDLMINLGK